REGTPQRRVEAVDAVDQTDAGHLHQVVDRLAVAELEGQGTGEAVIGLQELGPDGRVAGGGVGLVELVAHRVEGIGGPRAVAGEDWLGRLGGPPALSGAGPTLSQADEALPGLTEQTLRLAPPFRDHRPGSQQAESGVLQRQPVASDPLHQPGHERVGGCRGLLHGRVARMGWAVLYPGLPGSKGHLQRSHADIRGVVAVDGAGGVEARARASTGLGVPRAKWWPTAPG